MVCHPWVSQSLCVHMARSARPVDAISLGDLIGAAERDVQGLEFVIPIAGDEEELEVLHGKIAPSV